jgi:hypothetical protein
LWGGEDRAGNDNAAVPTVRDMTTSPPNHVDLLTDDQAARRRESLSETPAPHCQSAGRNRETASGRLVDDQSDAVTAIPTESGRSLLQQLDALGEANRVRTCRSRLKKDLKAGRQSVDQVLSSPPAEISTMSVFDFVIQVPRYGRVRAHTLLAKLALSSIKTIGGLSDRQRAEMRRLLAPGDRAANPSWAANPPRPIPDERPSVR